MSEMGSPSVFSGVMTSAPARRRFRPQVLVLFAAVALATALLSACGTVSKASATGAIGFNSNSCGTGWTHPKTGQQTLRLYNGATAGAEVDLIDPADGAIYAEADDIGPGTTTSMQVDLGSGKYAFRCLIEDTDAITGPTVRLGGHVKGERAVLPVTSNDLLEPARQYQAYVTAGLQVLADQTKTLDSDVLAGNLAAARTAWLPAHLTYERLGAAYDSFGDFDGDIDGRATGLVGGVASAQFTGFYRLEYGLWHGQSAKELTGPASQLQRDVLALQEAWPTMQISLLDIGLRTHEIMENALQFQLSGEDDYGSGTTLATVLSNITGTEELLTVLHSVLVPRYPGLPKVYAGLSTLQRLLAAQHHATGTWTPVSQLSTSAREQIDAAAGQLLQELAPIAVITEPRRTT
jgi:iron uptake system EfeUOB component EfeO/EfeM